MLFKKKLVLSPTIIKFNKVTQAGTLYSILNNKQSQSELINVIKHNQIDIHITCDNCKKIEQEILTTLLNLLTINKIQFDKIIINNKLSFQQKKKLLSTAGHILIIGISISASIALSHSNTKLMPYLTKLNTYNHNLQKKIRHLNNNPLPKNNILKHINILNDILTLPIIVQNVSISNTLLIITLKTDYPDYLIVNIKQLSKKHHTQYDISSKNSSITLSLTQLTKNKTT